MKLRFLAVGAAASILAAAAIVPTVLAAETGTADTDTGSVIRFHEGEDGAKPGHRGQLFEAIAAVLDTTVEELRARLGEGTSILEIATEQGQEDAVRQAAKDQITQHITDAVAAGRISQERADEMLANLDEKVENLLTRTEWGHRGHGRGHGGPGCDRDGADRSGETTQQTAADEA